MPVGNIKNIIDLHYGIYYIPAIAFGYLYLTTSTGVVIRNNIYIPAGYLWIASFLSLISGVMYHRVSQSIFGPEGPVENQKYRWTVWYHTIALLQSRKPRDTPNKASEIIKSLISPMGPRRLTSFLLYTLIILFYYVAFILSAILLFQIIIINQSSDLITGLLLFIQGLSTLQSIVGRRFPAVVKPESAQWLDTPEYQKWIKLRQDNIDKPREAVRPKSLTREILEWANEVNSRRIRREELRPACHISNVNIDVHPKRRPIKEGKIQGTKNDD